MTSALKAVEPQAQAAQTLPIPTGYHILIALLDVQEKTDGGILLPEEHTHREMVASVVGLVLSVGPDAYKNEKRFPTGPWCKKGDFILFNPYSGTRVNVHGKELRLINDDTVLAVVVDPRGVKRA